MSKLQLYGFSDILLSPTFSRAKKRFIANIGNELAMVASKKGLPALSSNQYKQLDRIFVMMRPEFLVTDKWNAYKAKSNYYTVFSDPMILDRSVNDVNQWEQCASYPGIQMLISRSESIKVSHLNQSLDEKFEELKGFRSVLFQHEVSHLDGVDFIMSAKEIRIKDKMLEQKHGEKIRAGWELFKNAKQETSDELFRSFRRDLVYRVIDLSR